MLDASVMEIVVYVLIRKYDATLIFWIIATCKMQAFSKSIAQVFVKIVLDATATFNAQV